MAIEDIYDDIGGLGTFQVIIIVWLYGLKSMVGWSMMQMSFAAYGPDYTCTADTYTYSSPSVVSTLSNSSYSSEQPSSLILAIPIGSVLANLTNVCSVNGTSCSSYVYDGVKRTVVTEFDLVCDLKWIRSAITSVQMGGVMFGAFVAGQAGDLIGRKRTNYGFYLLGAIFNIVAMFSTTWQMFMVFRFIIGISIGAMLVIVIPYPAEFFPQRWRYLVTVVPTWPVGVLMFALCAWLLEDWTYLHLVCAVLHVPGLMGYFYIPESVRWLTVQGRTEEAYDVIKKMARANRKPVPHYAKGMLERIAELERETQGNGRNYSYLDIFSSKSMCRLTLIFAFHWCSLSIVFYGLSFAVSGLSGDLYMNIVLMTSVEVPAYLFNLCLTQRLGRRWTCFAFYVGAAIAAGGCVVVHLSDSSAVGKALITALCMVAKLCAAACWAANQTWVTESYPTVTRSLGYASANVAARLGGILAPFIVNPGDHPLLTYSVMATMMFIAVILTPLIPETKDLVLSETVQALEEYGVNGDAVNNVQKKLEHSDDSSNAEDGPQDEVYHIGDKLKDKEISEDHLQMHLLGDGDVKFVNNGKANGVAKQSTENGRGHNTIPL
ncbi:hypothetical protein EGW08_008806 [Elysia chlorotica]|uniref:Major facilitator superfamily (MFS) profile domain-containing protein n=1 Tax=Elysia chlorotica TaxID=188477 RepID=A0A3S1HP83_ELYCH|nr:hypothetical protein EGW08_008806 [Elysia chlorotica]